MRRIGIALSIGFFLAVATSDRADTFQASTPMSFTQTGASSGALVPPTTGNGTIFAESPIPGVPPQSSILTELGFTWSPAGFSLVGGMGARWGCWAPQYWTAGFIGVGGMAVATTSTLGLSQTESFATSPLFRRYPHTNGTGSAATNSSGGFYMIYPQWLRGESAGHGGFLWWSSFALNTVNATQRVFVGLNASTSPSQTVDPSTLVNTAYFGCDAAVANMNFCTNAGSGTATCTDLGANFPCKTAGAFYTVWIWAAPNASSISYAIQRHDVAAATNGSVTTNLPVNTALLTWQVYSNSGSTAVGVIMSVMGVCGIANY